MEATAAAEEERLLKGILAQAKVDSESIRRLLAQSHIRASDLIAEPEHRAEEMLQKAGLLIGDIYKIVRALRGFHSDTSSSHAKPSRGAARGQPTMRCGLIVYSTTVLIVTVTLLSFYLPAMIYHVRSSNRRLARSGGPLAAQGHYVPGSGVYAGALPAARGPPGAKVMMVTANQPLPCTTRRGDWIMELALRNKLMCASLPGKCKSPSISPPEVHMPRIPAAHNGRF